MRREKGAITEALFSPAEYDVICIQEPPTDYFNPYKLRYWLIRGSKELKTAIYLHKKHKKNTWEYLTPSSFYTRLRLQHVYIYYFYSPISKGSSH